MPSGQVAPSGQALDDRDALSRLPAGSVGTGAIFTSRVNASHIIRKVLLRQEAVINDVNRF